LNFLGAASVWSESLLTNRPQISEIGIVSYHSFARFRRNAPSSTRSKTSGSSCATIGSQIASSNPTTISSTIAVRPGTSSSISHGASCPSDCANGRTGSNHWDLVLVSDLTSRMHCLTHLREATSSAHFPVSNTSASLGPQMTKWLSLGSRCAARHPTSVVTCFFFARLLWIMGAQ